MPFSLTSSLPPPPPPIVSQQDTDQASAQADLLGPPLSPSIDNSANSAPLRTSYPNSPGMDWQASPQRLFAEVKSSSLRLSGQPAPDQAEPLETVADRQEYDALRQVFSAVGNVVLQFRQAELKADRVQTDVANKILVAEGNVSLSRGGQVLRGERLEYNLVQERGSLSKASGVINLPQAQGDLDLSLPTRVTTDALQPLPDQFPAQPTPLQPQAEGQLERLRFEADRIEFEAGTWRGSNVRITNDPFSPPELEFRATQAILERISPTEDRITARRGRLVFDQRVALPLLREQVVLSRQGRDILPFDFAYDQDRGGLFVGRSFQLVDNRSTSLVATPQFFLQRAINSSFNLADPDLYGGTLRLRSQLGEQTRVTGYLKLTSLDLTEFSQTARSNLRLQQGFGDYRLNLEASLRDRLFNGSLGEQDVLNSVGAVFFSPALSVGNSGLKLSYQVLSQYVTAETERSGLRSPASLGRFQGSVAVRREFNLWQGQTLPPTPTGGLRYTPAPVQPYVQFYTGALGVSTGYSNGDDQQVLRGTIGFQGQFGNFSRLYGDYTGFNISFSQVVNSGESPFLFDRVVDFKVLSVRLLQQIYGPLRVGVQGSMNVDTGRTFNTDIILEYSRRTYGVVFRYSPDRQLGALVLRISGFNWLGNTDPFLAPDIRTVESGVVVPDN